MEQDLAYPVGRQFGRLDNLFDVCRVDLEKGEYRPLFLWQRRRLRLCCHRERRGGQGQLLKDIGSAVHQRAFLDQAVAPFAFRGIDPPGHGKNIPPLFQGLVCGDQGAGAVGGFDNHDSQREAADDPVSGGKAKTFRRGSQRVFADYCAGVGYLFMEFPVLAGIDNIQAAAHDRDGLASCVQCPPVGGGVYPQGKTAGDDKVVTGQFRGQPLYPPAARKRRPPVPRPSRFQVR